MEENYENASGWDRGIDVTYFDWFFLLYLVENKLLYISDVSQSKSFHVSQTFSWHILRQNIVKSSFRVNYLFIILFVVKMWEMSCFTMKFWKEIFINTFSYLIMTYHSWWKNLVGWICCWELISWNLFFTVSYLNRRVTKYEDIYIIFGRMKLSRYLVSLYYVNFDFYSYDWIIFSLLSSISKVKSMLKLSTTFDFLLRVVPIL